MLIDFLKENLLDKTPEQMSVRRGRMGEISGWIAGKI
jgi:hypothetical protein